MVEVGAGYSRLAFPGQDIANQTEMDILVFQIKLKLITNQINFHIYFVHSFGK